MNITRNISQLRKHLKEPLYRNSLFLMLNTGVNTGLGFFFWIIVARYYTEYEVGVGAAIISSVAFLALISTLGLDVALIRFLPKSQKPIELINSCFTLCGLVALVVSGIYVAGLPLWSPKISFVRDNAMFILVFLVYAIGWSSSALVDTVFVAKRRTEFTLIKNAIFSLLKIPLPIVLTLFFHAFGIVSSWGVAICIAIIISLFIFLPRIQPSYKPVPKINLSLIKPLWGYSLGNYFSYLFAFAPSLLLPVIIVNLVDATQNAYFYVAWTISGLLFTIPAAVSTSLFAEGSHAEEELELKWRRAYRFVIFLSIPAIIFMLLFGKWLLLLFGGNYSQYGLHLLWLLALSSLFTGINSLYYSILRVRNRVKELIGIRALAALAILVTSAIVTPTVGIVGIGYAWIGAQALVSLYVLIRVRSRYRARGLRQDGG